MATKKQKRAAALKKHEELMENVRLTGLAAQKQDQEYRARKLRDEWRERHDEKHSWRNLVSECPICQDMKKSKKKVP